MKKLIQVLLILVCGNLISQPGTFYKTYSTVLPPTAGNDIVPYSIIYSNCLFNAYGVYNDNALRVQKNDLNGNPILTKRITLPGIVNSDYLRIDTLNGFLFISGSRFGTTSYRSTFIAKVDTASLNVIFIKNYEFNNTNYHNIVYRSKILNDGTMILLGSIIQTSSGADQKALLAGINTTNGNVLYTNTLSVSSATGGIINSLTEISNSTFLFVGNGFIGKAVKTAGSYSISSVYSSYLFDKINITSNPKKAIVTGGNAIFKIDTSLALLPSSPPGIQLSYGNTPGYINTTYLNNKIYRLWNSKSMDIYDTSLVNVASVSYPFFGATGEISSDSPVSKNGSYLFVTTRSPQTPGKFILLKTDLGGGLNCSGPEPNITSPLNFNSSAATFSYSSITSTITTITPTVQTETITINTEVCIPSSLKETSFAKNLQIRLSENGYIINSEEFIQKVELYDITGRIIKKEIFDAPVTSVNVNLNLMPQGIYMARLTDSDNKDYIIKLIH